MLKTKTMSDKEMTTADWLAMVEADAGAGLEDFDLSDRDTACTILDRLDYEQQLTAINGLLRRNKAAEELLDDERKLIEAHIKQASGLAQERAIEESGKNVYAAVYQDAAHSMAAVGMIAPMYESIFYQAFQGIREAFQRAGETLPAHPRHSIANDDKFWDCHFLYSETAKTKVRTDLCEGILELANATGLALPDGIEELLEALFAYRNKMFHCGFEWPRHECMNFAARIKEEGWESWFSRAERGHEPWMFYLSEDFITLSLQMIDQVLDALGRYCKDRLPVVLIPIESLMRSNYGT